jgi:hypothetical protein
VSLRQIWLALSALFALAIVISSCSKREAAAPSLAAAEAPSDPKGADKPAALDPQGKSQAAMPRKVIRNGEVRLSVKAYDPARRALEAMVIGSGGYVSSSQVNHTLGEVSSAVLVLRVPAGQFGSILARISRLGTVTYESTSSQDISEQYYDLKARMANARKLEERYLELLKKSTGKITDVLQVEKELARVREEIERFEGKLRLFDNLVDLSTLTVHLAIEEKYTPPRPPSFGDDVRRTISDSWDALKSFGRHVLIALVALIPWAIPLGAAVWLFVWLVRRSNARRLIRKQAAAAKTTPPSPAAASRENAQPPSSSSASSKDGSSSTDGSSPK